MIGDAAPEDVYDAGDPLDVRLAVLERVAEELAELDAPGRRADALRVLFNLEDDVSGRLLRLRDLLDVA